MRILVTGGAGFIGAHLSRCLVADGHDLVVLDDLSTGSRANIRQLDVDLRIGSILDVAAVDAAAARVDTIIHLAAVASVQLSVVDPSCINDANVTGTLNVLQAARRWGAHLVFASSSAVYGAGHGAAFRESARVRPTTPYAASKSAGESYVQAFQHSYDLSALIFRFFNVYGPLQNPRAAYAAAVPSFLSALYSDRALTIYGDGGQTRDFISVASVVDVIAAAIQRRFTSLDPLNLAVGRTTSLLELLTLLQNLTGRQARIIHRPDRVGDLRQSVADCANLRLAFPHLRPQPLEVGLKATVDWFIGGEDDLSLAGRSALSI